MGKILNTAKRSSFEKRSFRRWVRQLFVGWIKHQNSESKNIYALLQDIKDSVEIIAREIARQSKRGKK